MLHVEFWNLSNRYHGEVHLIRNPDKSLALLWAGVLHPLARLGEIDDPYLSHSAIHCYYSSTPRHGTLAPAGRFHQIRPAIH